MAVSDLTRDAAAEEKRIDREEYECVDERSRRYRSRGGAASLGALSSVHHLTRIRRCGPHERKMSDNSAVHRQKDRGESDRLR